MHWPEYVLIQNFYGDAVAQRSGVRLIQHIDEGIRILDAIEAPELAKRAYCLHPVLQADEALAANYKRYTFDAAAVLLAMEYRSVANEYLSQRSITHIDEIRLSPLSEVNQMLIADKVQNYKDFELYHQHTHPRAAALTQYFNNWLRRLDISPERYQALKASISH